MTTMNKKYIKGMFLLGLTASIGLSSCQITNKYKSPEYDSQDLYRGENPTDTTTIAHIPWRDYFNDPILQSLIEEGIDNNLDLKIAYTSIKQAEANLGMARAAYFPTVSLTGQVNQTRSSANALTGGDKKVLGYRTEAYTLGIAATWEADIWGKLNRQSRSSYAVFLSSEAYKNLIQTSLVANIATSYYSLLALDEQLKITKQTIILLQESTETMIALKDAGLLNGASVEQSKALLYGTQTSIPDLENQITQMENSICTLLGRKPGPIARGSFDSQKVPKSLAYGVPMQMLAMRPDVQQAELSFRSAFELTQAAYASFYPTISLTSGTIGYQGTNTLAQFFKPEHIFANIIGGFTQPIFAKKQLTGQLKIRKAQQESALLTFEQTVLAAGTEVTNVLSTYETSMQKNEPRQNQVNSLNTAVYFTKELLIAGDANYTEVLTAEQNLLSAQLNQVSDKLTQLQSTVNLYRALGGGVN